MSRERSWSLRGRLLFLLASGTVIALLATGWFLFHAVQLAVAGSADEVLQEKAEALAALVVVEEGGLVLDDDDPGCVGIVCGAGHDAISHF
jgi:hypothetical protein